MPVSVVISLPILEDDDYKDKEIENNLDKEQLEKIKRLANILHDEYRGLGCFGYCK